MAQQARNGWIAFAGLSGFVAVAMGAVGAHLAADAYLAGLVEKASYYQLIHAAVILVLAKAGPRFRFARWLFVIGTLLFCGALYLKGMTGWNYASKPAPTGGVSFMLGWLALLWAGLRTRS